MQNNLRLTTCQKILDKDFDPRDLSVRFDEAGNWLTMEHFMCGKPVEKVNYCAPCYNLLYRGTGKRAKDASLFQRLFEAEVGEELQEAAAEAEAYPEL